MPPITIMWFRRDLRLADNPALTAAVQAGQVLPVWIDEAEEAGDRAPGGAARVWLHHNLAVLDQALGGRLAIYRGAARDVLQDLTTRFDVRAVHWNRCYEPWRGDRDQAIKTWLRGQGIGAHSHNGSLLWEPWGIHKADGTPYKVFTPYYRRGCLAAPAPRYPLPVAKGDWVADPQGLALDDLSLIPERPWGGQMMEYWQAGEAGGAKLLRDFIINGLTGYDGGRDFPAQPHVSRLSPYLQVGALSPNQIWYAIREAASDQNADKFCAELGWREFSYSLLYNNPDLHSRNLQPKFDGFPWINNPEDLRAWQRGQTGIPIVDAGMQELWHTGYMHNRVRMIVASFLVKNLMVDWRQGEAWFWDTLIDADPASNAASWQWVAGCGADAAPYFRIFNPVTQGQKFDGGGAYIRKWVPELRNMPDKHLFAPHEAPPMIRVQIDGYPEPIVDLKTSRLRALDAFATLK